MPTHNRADVIGYAIQSVLNQSFSDFELMIVGDGCTDHTANVVAGFDDPRIIWMDLPKAPHFGYANRNIAFKRARGRYIGFMAHDDIILGDHFTLCIDQLDRDEALELVYSRPGWVTGDGLLIGVEFNLLNKSTRIPFLQKRHNALPASCVVHRRSCFKKYGYWNADLPSCGDWDMWVRIISGGGGNNFTFISEITCLHFVAVWKDDINSGLLEALHWRTLYQQTDDLPAILMRDIPSGQTEQEVIWKEICAAPDFWPTRLRTAIAQVFDLRIVSSVAQINYLQQAIGELKQDIQSLKDIPPVEKKAAIEDLQRQSSITNEHLIELLQSMKVTQQSSMDQHQEVISVLERKMQHVEQRIEAIKSEVNTVKGQQDQIDLVKKEQQMVRNSFSWKIGRGITKSIDFLFGWIPGVHW